MTLTPAQEAVLRLMIQGQTPKEAARNLGISYCAAMRRVEEARKANGSLLTTYQLMYRLGMWDVARRSTIWKVRSPQGRVSFSGRTPLKKQPYPKGRAGTLAGIGRQPSM